ncbi:MAG: hypothetical protein KGI80_04525 [Verrucomicrobiota bacterium]|nr:hypothetical protein [Verrucomicrobiota bacterium]
MNRTLLLGIALPLLAFGIDTGCSYWDYHPLHAAGQTIQIANAHIDAPQGGKLYFGKTQAYVSMLTPITETSYFIPEVQWNQLIVDWNKNPKFDTTTFSYAQFGLLFYSTGLDRWRWIVRGTYDLDIEHFSNPSLYGYFSWLLWGAYQLAEDWRFHLGGLGYVGLENEMTYPLLGIDYSPTSHWTIEAIFPITYSVQYKLNTNWRFSLVGRPIKQRFRVGAQEREPRAIFSYTTFGTEVNVRYALPLRLEIEVYGGYDVGGNFYIKNQHGSNPLYTTVKGAPYIGGLLNLGF